MQKAKHLMTIAAVAGVAICCIILLQIPRYQGPALLMSVGLCLTVAFLLGYERILHRPSKLIYLAVAAALFALPFAILTRAFGDFDVLALVFHAQFGVEGATLSGFEGEIAEGVVAVFGLVFAGYATAALFGRQVAAYAATTCLLIALNPFVRFGHLFWGAEQVESELHLALEDLEVKSSSGPHPDIIIVYLEGLERSYGVRSYYGDIFAPLETYERRGLSLTQVLQVRGTGWSLAGLVATQCGLPLLPNGLRSHYRFWDQVNFLGDHLCLGGITAALGYQNSFVVGSTAAFGGIDHFLRTHHIQNIADYHAISDKYPPAVLENSHSGPILDDQLVFDSAKKIYDQKRANNEPMLLIVETYGPHGQSSLLSANCTGSGQVEVSPDVEMAITCTLENMIPFLDHIEQNRGDRPTVVMLASDHLNHDILIDERFSAAERSNTIIIYGLGFEQPLAPPGTVIDRPATMMDVFPTFLAYAGLAEYDSKAGMGRSLFGTEATLMEQEGFVSMNAQLFPNPILNAAIWQGTPNKP